MQRRPLRLQSHPDTNAKNQMLKPVQHDKKKYVILNLSRNLEFWNGNELIAFVLVILGVFVAVFNVASGFLKVKRPRSPEYISPSHSRRRLHRPVSEESRVSEEEFRRSPDRPERSFFGRVLLMRS